MGANQSTARHAEAGHSRGLTCCGRHDDEDELVEAPEKHLRIRDGHVQTSQNDTNPGLRSPLRTPEPTTPVQPATRLRMDFNPRQPSTHVESICLSGLQEKPSVSRNANVMAKKFGMSPTVTFEDEQPGKGLTLKEVLAPPPAQIRNVEPVTVEGPKLELPLLGLGSGDMLPQNKRLSPMPDFARLQSEEIKKIADSDTSVSSEPWLMVRSIAEKTPSRRSSVFEPSTSPRLRDSKSMSSRSVKSPPQQNSAIVSPARPTRPRAQTDVQQKGRVTSDEPPSMPSQLEWPRSQAPHLRLQTDFSRNHLAKPSLTSNPSTTASDDTSKGSARGGSPQRKRSKIARMRKESAPAPLRTTSVEDAVRELEQIVQAKRDPETPATATPISAMSDRKLHRPAIAPNMVMPDVSSALLNDIGSGLSRRLSEATTASPFKNPDANSTASSLPLSTISRRRSAGRDSRRESSWHGTVTSDSGSATPRTHDGTFFFSRKSLDEIISPESKAVTPSSLQKLSRGGESPVDKQWSAERITKPQKAKLSGNVQATRSTARKERTATEKPLPAKPPPGTPSSQYKAEPNSNPAGPNSLSFHKPNLSTASHATTMTNFSINSSTFPSPPDTSVPEVPVIPSQKSHVRSQKPVPEVPSLPLKPKYASEKKHYNHNDSAPTAATQHHQLLQASTKHEPSESHPEPERTFSRGDQSSAVLAARKRAAEKLAQEEAAGMGLGIGGILSPNELANVVEMDVWDAKPAHEHPSRSRAGSVATHKTDSVLVEPSMSPQAAFDGIGGLVEGVERAMSVRVPKQHVAQLVRTPSGKSATSVKAQKSREDSLERTKKEESKQDDREWHRPLAGMPRKASGDSNTLPGTTRPPSQNEAKKRKAASHTKPQQESNVQNSSTPKTRSRGDSRAATASQQQYRTGTPTHSRPGSRQGASSPSSRHRAGSSSTRHQGVEFGLDLQRSASARRLKEVEARLAQIERARELEAQKMPQRPAKILSKQYTASSQDSSPIDGSLAPPSGPYIQGKGVRASQVGMAF